MNASFGQRRIVANTDPDDVALFGAAVSLL